MGENSERVASWVEENDIAVGFGLRWWPHGAERDGAFLGVIKIGNVDIEVRLLRHRARRPSGRHVVLHPHRGQQETRELDNGNVFGGENNLPLETWTGGSDGSPVDAGISSWVPVDGSIRKATKPASAGSQVRPRPRAPDHTPPPDSPAGMVVRSTTSFSMPNICASVFIKMQVVEVAFIYSMPR